MTSPTKAPSISLSGSNLRVDWGRSSMDVHVEDAGALAKLLESVGLMAGGERVLGEGAATPVPSIPDLNPDPKAAKRKRRKSRKNVGDALVIWMSAHPGWHSEESLLKTVIAHRMSDAEPKRALKIALGRKKDEVFVTDGLGNWQLKEDLVREVPHGIGGESEGDEGSRWDSSSAQEIARARKNLLGA